MKKVLIVTWGFAPCSNMGAKRYGLMCKYFMENGYEPYVIAASAETSGGSGVAHELEIPIPSEHVMYVDLDKEGMYFTSAILKVFEKLKLFSRTVQRMHFWYKNVITAVDLEQLKEIGFDVVIGTYGPMVNLYVAKYLSKKMNCKYIVDVRDLISDYAKNLPQGYTRTKKLDYIIEKASLGFADGIVTVNPQMTADMRKRYPGKRIATVSNGWDGEQKECHGICTDKYLYFGGTVHEYMLDSLCLLFRALKAVNEKENIKMIIRCFDGQSAKVKRMVRKMKMQDIVFCLPPVSEKIVMEERRKSYINVALNSIHEEDYDAKASIPGKAYEYMREKAPVLAIVFRDSNLAKILRYTDKGIGTNSESEITEFILNAEGRFKGNDNVLKFSRQYQAARLCRFMDYILKH